MKSLLLLAPTLSWAATIASDPSDAIPPSVWAADNAVVPNNNVPANASPPPPVLAANTYSSPTNVDHKKFSADANDTSVILVSGSSLNASYIEVVKSGYSSNPATGSSSGSNAAINIANGSRANLDHINVTAHNGAANLVAYGSGTMINVKDAWLYSSGPLSSGLLAAGNGTIIGRNIRHFSGGVRSSSFSGDLPEGDIYVYDSRAHTQGIGSAAFNAMGTIYAENVISVSEKSPAVLADGPQSVTLVHCESRAGLLGGVAYFNSQQRRSGASLRMVDSRITVTGNTVPGLWFGNTAANVTIQSSDIITDSGVLVVANYSYITPDFDHYGSYAENNNILPAEVNIVVSESTLRGDLVAYNSSVISWTLNRHSAWTGSAYAGSGAASFQIAMDSTSTWNLTRSSVVQHLVAEDKSLSNIHSNGHTLHYDAAAAPNSWLGGKTIRLRGGGSAVPLSS